MESAGECGKKKVPCKNYYFTIEDKVMAAGEAADEERAEGSDPYQSSSYKPDLFFSGEVHGDEMVGPLAVIHTAELLLHAASCARHYYATSTPDVGSSPHCKSWFGDHGYSEQDMRWLANLVSSRRIIMSPMSNALGFSNRERREKRIDPNRDFAFDVKSPEQCMQTITARHVNYIFRNHLITAGITFHAGMTAIAYEWGAPSYNENGLVSPDNYAQRTLAKGLSDYGGTFKISKTETEKKYPYDQMNNNVYAVNGGMEDWSYAGSWSPHVVKDGCNPGTFGGYPREETVYNGATLRAVNLLVETSKAKKPYPGSLGNWEGIFDPKSPNNGHIPR